MTVLPLILLMPYFISHYLDRSSLDVRAAVAYVTSHYQPGDSVIAYSNEFRYYLPKNIELGERAGQPVMDDIDWNASLDALKAKPGRTWLVFQRVRAPLQPRLENWLTANARLVWRKSAKRLDVEVRGYEVWLVN